jgi:chaperonin GroEL
MDEHTRLSAGGRAEGPSGQTICFFDAVREALGPKGKPVVIASGAGLPLVTKDGMTLARCVRAHGGPGIADQEVKDAGILTERNAGDGAGTAMLIAMALCERIEAMRPTLEQRAGMAQGFALGLLAACEMLRTDSRTRTSHQDVLSVASTSAGNDMDLGRLVAHAIRQVGPYGGITIEPGAGSADRIFLSRGIEFEGAYMAGDAAASLDEPLVFDDASVAVVTGRLSDPAQLSSVLNAAVLCRRPLVVFAADVDEYIATLFHMNSEQGLLKSCVVKAPYRGERQRAFLDDLAALTGARVVAADLQGNVPDGRIAGLGRARKVKIGTSRTTVVGAGGDAGTIAERVRNLYARYPAIGAASDRDFLRKRIGRLAGGVATIQIGATNMMALHERARRAKHAVASARAAMASGHVPGGGVALLRTRQAIEERRGNDELVNAGLDLLLEAVQAPAMQIARNAGAEPYVVLRHILKEGGNTGFDVMTSRYVDMVQAGILDATSVVCEALTQGVEAAVRVLAAVPESGMAEAERGDSAPNPMTFPRLVSRPQFAHQHHPR